MPTEASPYGVGMTQDDMMKKDQCILLDQDDKMIGHASKVETHQFNEKTPRGLLHRAFSVFLFDSAGRLLLQQRASTKITFPNVWTNTCCSHPLYGYEPSEVDEEKEVARGNVSGAINAAIRKLEHELGIPRGTIPPSQFKYLTRLHYWAADVVTHGKKSPWGEHEIDYILFVQADVPLKPHPDEVDAVKYVTLTELREQMDPASGLLWSPWFRIIAEQFLPYWWKDLNATLTTNEWVDWNTIHRFDPTKEHMGGAGKAGPLLGNKNAGLKQGGYGKVTIHAHSKFERFRRIDEVFCSIQSETHAWSLNHMLGKVSRSFAAVIRQLPKGLCADIMIFYLALRALDTIEDDMTAFKGNEKEKIRLLNNFYKEGLVTDGWTMSGDLGQGTVKVSDYDVYCHYVAGLVGEGLNYVDGRAFWPQEIWKQYTNTGDLGELAKEEARPRAVQCLNHLLYNNPKVFTGVVKIRKFQSAKLILDTTTVEGVHKWFNICVRNILKRVPVDDPNAEDTKDICREVLRLTDEKAVRAITGAYGEVANGVASSVFAVSSYMIFAADGKAGKLLNLVSSGSLSFASLKGFVTQAGNHWAAALGTSIAFIFGYAVAASSKSGLAKADQ
eukprot:GSChrysophyteH1.ASY1.ANO1.2884.1 assembled CDS